jgi:xylulokinase
VLEGVAFGMADGLAALQQAGTQVRRLSLVGGGARSALWAQLLADALGVEIVTHAGGEAGAALGAARLAQLALGGDEASVCIPPAVAARFHARPERHAALQSRLQRFRQLYQRLQPLWRDAATA